MCGATGSWMPSGLQWISRMFGKIRSDIGESFLDEVLAESASFLMGPYMRGIR